MYYFHLLVLTGLIHLFLKIRHDGSYGNVFVVVNSINQTAQRNVDFLLPSSGVTVYFADGQTKAEMSVGLLDDDLIEHEEKFTLALTDASGGARIGSRKTLDVSLSVFNH